jgi:hypothetical protein
MKKKRLRVLAVCLFIVWLIGGCQVESTPEDQKNPDNGNNNIFPLVIKNLIAVGADRRVTAKWDSLDLVEEYEVEIRDGMGYAETIKADNSFAVISDLQNDTEYVLRVRAYLNGNIGAWSGLVSAVPIQPLVPPQEAPGNLRLLADDQMITGEFNPVESASEYAVLVNGMAHAVT